MSEEIIAVIITSTISLIIGIVSCILNFIFKNINDRKLEKQKSISHQNIENLKTETQTKIELLKSKVEKSNYVSKVVFDKIFITFEKLSISMFKIYNNNNAEMFPFIEHKLCFINDNEAKAKHMNEVLKKDEKDLNEFVNLVHTNKFILSKNLLNKITDFEKESKQLFQWYKEKILDETKTSLAKIIDTKQNNELIRLAEHTHEIYNEIQTEFNIYISNLIIID